MNTWFQISNFVKKKNNSNNNNTNNIRTAVRCSRYVGLLGQQGSCSDSEGLRTCLSLFG
uniref:Uncharacterized protein n=1 Tax=Anguilla anguilla TaxID=7936 RepID=A0A0E9VH40_ANGAN